MSGTGDVEELWQERLSEARVRTSPGIEPERLAERYDAETADEIEQLTKRAVVGMLNDDYSMLTLGDLDKAAEKLGDGDTDHEIVTDGGRLSEAGEELLTPCFNCSSLADRRQMNPIDLSRDDEYYPKIRYLCARCSPSGDGGQDDV